VTTFHFLDILDEEKLKDLGSDLSFFRPPRPLLSPPYLDLFCEEEALAHFPEAPYAYDAF
jgi:hypothetical protein